MCLHGLGRSILLCVRVTVDFLFIQMAQADVPAATVNTRLEICCSIAYACRFPVLRTRLLTLSEPIVRIPVLSS